MEVIIDILRERVTSSMSPVTLESEGKTLKNGKVVPSWSKKREKFKFPSITNWKSRSSSEFSILKVK
jgi:hypothetical protein